MSLPASLGVPVMDQDHPRIDAMIAAAAGAPDAELSAAFEQVAAEIAAHFAREEAVMREGQVPILPQHLMLHARLIAEVEAMRGAQAAALRAFLERALPRLIDDHVASADTMTAAFLTGRFGAPVGRASSS